MKVFDVVSCRFPHRETPDQPGPKIRPVLVLALDETLGVVQVVYGTSQAHTALQAWHLMVNANAVPDGHAAGIRDLVIFDFSNLRLLPKTSVWFPNARGKNTPVIGFLHSIRHPEAMTAYLAGQRRKP